MSLVVSYRFVVPAWITGFFHAAKTWSMLDIYVLALGILCIEGNVLGVVLEPGPGFWWFLTSVLVSVLANISITIYQKHKPPIPPDPEYYL